MRTSHVARVVLVAWSAFVAAEARGQEAMAVKRTDVELAAQTAREALGAYVAHVISEGKLAQFGFKTESEARLATVGDPIPVVVVEHRALKAYAADASPRSVWADAGALWFPVSVGTDVRTKLEVVRIEGRWVPGEFGGQASDVANARAQLPGLLRAKGFSGRFETTLVRIPLLQADFIYAGAGADEYLLPVMPQPERFGLRNGELYRAAEVLAKLKAIAAKVKEGTIN
jgi:hypothetical protein